MERAKKLGNLIDRKLANKSIKKAFIANKNHTDM